MKICSVDDVKKFLVAMQCFDSLRSIRNSSVHAYVWLCRAFSGRAVLLRRRVEIRRHITRGDLQSFQVLAQDLDLPSSFRTCSVCASSFSCDAALMRADHVRKGA